MDNAFGMPPSGPQTNGERGSNAVRSGDQTAAKGVLMPLVWGPDGGEEIAALRSR